MEQEIKTVAVLGAGAVGSYLIWGLTPKLGENLWVIAEGARADRLRENGIEINGQKIKLNIRAPKEAHNVDLLIVSAKYGALRSSLPDIAAVVGENTTVLSLMNGVDSEEIIGAEVGMEHMLYSLIKISSERKGNSICFDPEKTPGICYGEPGPDKDTPRIRALNRLFADTALRVRTSDRIFYEIWMKYCLNVRYNLPQAVLGVGIGAFWECEYPKALSAAIAEEVIAVAKAKGIDISDARADETIRTSRPGARYSTLQDLDAGRRTEIDMFAGVMVRMGQALNIPTPYCSAMLLMIKTLEEKNEGRFDYE